MAQTLTYLDDVIASFPDNTAALITPVQMRDFTVSMAIGGAFVEDTTPVTIPVVSGTAVAMNPLLTAATATEFLWSVDGNNFMFPDYAASLAGTVVPAGYEKVVTFVSSLVLSRSGGGTTNYDFQFGRSPSDLIGLPTSVEWTAAYALNVTVINTLSVDVSDVLTTYGVYVTGVGTGTNLTLESFEFNSRDRIRNTAP